MEKTSCQGLSWLQLPESAIMMVQINLLVQAIMLGTVVYKKLKMCAMHLAIWLSLKMWTSRGKLLSRQDNKKKIGDMNKNWIRVLWKVIWNKNAINRVIHHAKDSPIQSLGLREQRNILITKWNKNGWWTYIKQPNWCAGCLAIRRSILGVNGPEQMVYIPKHSINAPKGSIKKAQTTNSWMCNLGNDTGGQIKVHNRDE